jgi:nucleotide-binding universal stress UspA family protein
MSESPRPIQNIVIGVGPRFWDDPALPAALELGRARGARLHVVRAFDPPDGPTSSAGEVDHEAVTRRREEILTGLCGQVEALGGGPEARCHVRLGAAAEVVAAVSGEVRADLVVVGAARKENLALRFLGTKAERIVVGARCPVLVLREPVRRPVRHVLFSMAPLPESASIFDGGRAVVRALFADDRPDLRLLNVTWEATRGRDAEATTEGMESARDELEALVADRGVQGATVRVRNGMPAGEILAEAREWPADLVVLGTHGRTGRERVLLGSVCASVLRDLGRNALVIPPVASLESPPRSAGERSEEGVGAS